MWRTFLLAIALYALVIAGLITLQGRFLALALLLALYFLAGLLHAPAEPRLEIHRSLSAERVLAGTPVTVTLTLTNLGSALDEIQVEDQISSGLKVIEGTARRMFSLKNGQTLKWTYTIRAGRGYYPFPALRVTVRDHFGLVQRERTFSTPGHLFVLPPVLRLQRIVIRPRQTRVYSGTIPARVGGAGVEFFGVREYQPGDSPHRINWHVSARQTQAIFTNEFEQERVADVGIVLDGRYRTNVIGSDRSLFEYSVLAATALADAFISQGNRVGLLLYGRYLNWTFPGYGKIQRERLLQALSHAEPGESQVFSDLAHIPTRLFPAHSQIVLISPLAEDDLSVLISLRSRGYQVMVISPNPVTFEQEKLPSTPETALAARVIHLERRLLLMKLQRAGIQVLDWDVKQPFEQAAGAAFGRPPAWQRAIGR
jgi:uncharacterized protein (DUF58 family)